MRASLLLTVFFLISGFWAAAQTDPGAGGDSSVSGAGVPSTSANSAAAQNAAAQSASANSASTNSALQNYNAGRDMENKNRAAEAAAYYNEAVRICQDEVSRNEATRDTYTIITRALRRLNRHADVISWGERGLRLFSNELRIVEIMGEAYFYLNNYNSSLLYMQRYVNAAPQGESTPLAYFFIGEIYRITKKYRHADIAYTTAVYLNQGNALWWYRLATVREAAGDKAAAAEAFRQALQRNPNYREAQEGLARVRE